MYQNEIIGDLPEPAQLSMEDCWNIRNILFLRDRLEEVLNRDIATLISKISSYDYIKPLNPGEPVILHISDLHVSLDNKEAMINAIQENEKNVQDKSLALKNINPDLILITGDVAQASYSAPSLVKNYEAAEEVIKEIVSIVWGFSGKEKERDIRLSEMEFIRNDWKKRVLISTGNHDYASMNELEAQNKARMTLSGVPGENIGSTMIKYSYFINFLHNLLGIDIDRATRYDLNDIIQYHHLKLSVFNINSGSGVNPYRTNKVQINTQAVKELNMMETKKYRSIHMMHHTPIYSINYINDIYYMDRNFLVKLYEDIQKNLGLPKIDNISEMWLSMIANSMTGFEKTLEGINGEMQEKILLALIEGIKKKDLRTYIDKNLSDLKHYLNIRRQKRNTDDRCSQVMSALREKEEMSRNDNQAYAVSVKDYLSEVGEEFYILGGHEHYECKYSGNCVGVLSKCRGIFEAGKFFSKAEKKLHYSVLEFGGDYNFVNESGDIGKIFGNDTIKEILREEKNSNEQNP